VFEIKLTTETAGAVKFWVYAQLRVVLSTVMHCDNVTNEKPLVEYPLVTLLVKTRKPISRKTTKATVLLKTSLFSSPKSRKKKAMKLNNANKIMSMKIIKPSFYLRLAPAGFF